MPRRHLEPFGYSGPSYFADGGTVPPSGPGLQVEAREVVIAYPDSGWTFTVAYTPRSGSAAGVGAGGIEDAGKDRWRLVPPAPTGVHDVWVNGDRGGYGANFVFRWTVMPA